MPIYLYQHPETEEIVEVVQSMNDEHKYVDSNGVEWRRVFVNPHACIDGRIDPNNPKDFVEKTGKKKGNLGDLFDRSREASEKREKVYGKDPVKDKYFDDWSKKRKGKTHPLKQQNGEIVI